MNWIKKMFSKKKERQCAIHKVSSSFNNYGELVGFRTFVEAYACLPKYFIDIHTDTNVIFRVYHTDNEDRANDGIAPDRVVDAGIIHGQICWMCLK